MLDKVSDWTAESLRLQQIIHGEREELKKRLADVNRSIFKVDAELKELKEANRKALENREEYHRSTLLDWFTSRESIFSSMNRTDTDGDCRSLVREITIRVSEQSQKLSELRKEITAYTGNFSEDNVFAFKTSFSDDKEYMDFACDLKEFIDEDKVSGIPIANQYPQLRYLPADYGGHEKHGLSGRQYPWRGGSDQRRFQGEELRGDYPVYRDAY